jgi:hypothetical protein
LTAVDWLLAAGVFIAGVGAGRLAHALARRQYGDEDAELGPPTPSVDQSA